MNPNVTRYLAQPHRLEIMTERPRPLIYFPDVRIEYADGSVEIVEIKRTEEELQDDPDYAEKLAGAASVYAALGWTFRVVIAEEEIDVDPLYSNAKRICADRHSLILRPAALAIEEVFHVETEIALGKAEEIVARSAGIPLDQAVAIVRAMVCTRRVAVNAARRIHRDSPVTKPEGAPGPRAASQKGQS